MHVNGLSLLLLALAGCATEAENVQVRSIGWAQPVLGGEVDNWYVVSDELHRCAQPSADGMQTLAANEVRSVVNLREHHSDRDEVRGVALQLVEVPLDTGDMTYADLVAALRAVLAAPKPVALHCWRGSDRTGAVVAAWRVAVQGWSAQQALDEMALGGFGHSRFYGNLRRLVAGLDGERLRRDVGLRDESTSED